MAQISTTKCYLCSTKNDGSIFYYECKQAMCISCKSFHEKIPPTQKHKVSDLNKVDRLVFQSELVALPIKSYIHVFVTNADV